MALVLHTPRERTIEFDGGSITLRGLSLKEMVESCETIASGAGPLFDGAIRPNIESMMEDESLIRSLVWLIIEKAPDVVANLIATAADAKDQIETVRQLPLDVALVCLENIYDLSIGSAENFVAIVCRVGNAASQHSRFINGARH